MYSGRITQIQGEAGIWQEGRIKTTDETHWRAIVDKYPTQIAAAQAMGIDKAWLRKQAARYNYNWLKDHTPPDRRDGKPAKNKLYEQLEKRYTKEELEALAKGRSTPLVNSTRRLVDFSGDVLTIGYYSDTHIGAKYFSENWFASMWAEFARQKVNMTIHSGDVFEGMNTRPGHVFECDHVGYQSQREYAVKLYKKHAMPKITQYFIDGNHDRWYTKENGANIVQDLCDKMGYDYLGQDEGDVILDKWGITVRAWHGEDGNSYATSYRLQKLVEAFSGGEKPHVLLTGHTHKSLYAFVRNVHCVSGGALSRQSKWMRSKRIENHAGFWVIRLGLGRNDIKWIEPRFYPFYK